MPSIEEIASSRPRLTIASLISSRPRTLSELAEMTSISVQGVLKHLKRLEEEGIVKEWNMAKGRYLRPRKLYYAESRRVADFSQDDLLVAALRKVEEPHTPKSDGAFEALDAHAQDIIIQHRRARELSKKMTRMIDAFLESEMRIGALIDSMDLEPDEKQVAHLIFGDDGPVKARRVLRNHYGCADPDAAIRAVIRKIRRPSAR